MQDIYNPAMPEFIKELVQIFIPSTPLYTEKEIPGKKFT